MKLIDQIIAYSYQATAKIKYLTAIEKRLKKKVDIDENGNTL
jgi:hypothetical protein